MRLALAFLAILTVPLHAQDAAQWKIEPGSPRRAATIEYDQSETLSYGFSCWRQRWIFFFNHQAPQGGVCADHDDCEGDVAEVTLTFKIPQHEEFTDKFTLFENYYFQAEDLSVRDVEAMIKAGHFSLKLDDKLKAIWEREDIDFPLQGFEQAVDHNSKLLACEVRAPLPIPLARPDKAMLDGAPVKEKAAKASKKKRKTELREKRSRLKALKKRKPARIKATKKKLRR